ncbi:phosphonate ABC transporter ATP-binding protein [Labrenzia sp. R4_2]|uniref:phosphonate ABC transporter ATP-binding protein n=1 Tax=Labrenzia sp. R4_2 TaxID=2821107 RepID=UPI001ADB40A8|nr:phosphonate ABC transporter ATP-binding protein [Labrenzia sp. R4_2]MBO9418882.1 phosphonate ABC transporter ATP-binding protein [Labrenzia sp. R4_2]
MSAITVKRLSKTFRGGIRALDGVDLTVADGEFVALIGASGSGKSTLIRHISGLVAGDRNSGCCQISINGHPVQDSGAISKNISATRTGIGVVFQQFNLVPRLSVLTNVLAGLLGKVPVWRGLFGFFSSEEKQLAMRALQRVGIETKARQRASTLSGGQQQRAAIARTIVQGAKIILADEPIASLDPASAKRVMGILSRINEEDGTTVVVSLHQVEYARRYCKRTIAMRAGQIVYDGPSHALTTQFLREIYGEASEELVLPDAEDFGTAPIPATA